MGMMDKFREFMCVSGEDDYDDDDLDYVPKEEKPREEKQEIPTGKKKDGNKVVNIAATTNLSVVLVKPKVFEDATAIADHLNAKRTVVLNLENAGKEDACRLVDFLGGVAYANEGRIERVANQTFIITPYNVDFMDDLLDELENNGVFF